MKEYLETLTNGKDLSFEQATSAMQQIMSGNASDAQIGGFLAALRTKGETIDEISAFANVMRQYSVKVHPEVDGVLLDMCGTGGDGKSTFNISTAAMFVVASAGVYVAKHGNRSITSNSGSADVLESLGGNINLNPDQIKKCIEEVGIGFMFAPNHHPSMKHVMPARKQLGVKTVFNILGPLTNPADAKSQVMGVFDKSLTEKLAHVLKTLDVDHALVVNGVPGIDEVSNIGATTISELKDGKVDSYEVTPEELGIEKASLSDLAGGSSDENAVMIKDILSGYDRGPKRDIVALNAGAGLVAAGVSKDLAQGFEKACSLISSGQALNKLSNYVKCCQNVVH